jgi:hypothetical protein
MSVLKTIQPVEPGEIALADVSAPTSPAPSPPIAIDERAGAERPYRYSATERALTALSYLGAFSLLAYAVVPRRQFVARHVRLAVAVHLLRFFWLAVTLVAWWALADPPAGDYRLVRFAGDLGMLFLFGVPWTSTYHLDVLPWLVTPLVVTWLLSIVGFLLAATAKTADFDAFMHADWSEAHMRRRWLWRPPEEEKRQARIARDRHMQRLQYAHRMVTGERQRRDRMSALEDAVRQLEAERSHNDQLLAVGELSRRRYDALNAQIDAELDELRERLAELTARVVMTSTVMPERMRISRLERGVESKVDTIAIVTPSGVPLFTYGHFQIDEALVAGILSAFDSVTEEVFGSRVHKTELAEGEVLYFAHGQHVIVMAIYAEEPSPRQIEQLRTMLQQFEVANQSQLARNAFDPTYLHEVQIPFKFSERVPRSE